MKNKRRLIIIIILIIIVGGVIVYKEVEKNRVNNNSKAKTTKLENTQKLNQAMFVKYYNEQIKANKNNDQNIICYLLDVYNNSFAIELFSNTNKFNEFIVGNIDEKLELVDNKNSMYCGIKPDGEITSYSNYGNNSAKKEPFILKK